MTAQETNIFLTPGTVWPIYQKPLTFEDFEGDATLIRKLHTIFDGERWLVEFAGGDRVERLIPFTCPECETELDREGHTERCPLRFNTEKPKGYGEMLAEHVCGIASYSADDLAAAARKQIGLPDDTPVHIAMPQGSDELRAFAAGAVNEYRRCLQMPGVIRHPDGVLELPS